MAYLDELMPQVDDPSFAQQLYPWLKRDNSLPLPPAAAASVAPMPAGRVPAQPLAAPAPPSAPATAPLAAVPVGPSAAATPASTAPFSPMQPVSLGPQAQPLPPAAAALAASKPPELHGWKNALDVVGQTYMPRLEEAIPGTPGNYRQQVRPLLEKQASEEARSQAEGLAGRKDEATIARDAAEAANLNSEAAARANPKAKSHPILINGPDGEPTPALQNMVTGEITDDTGAAIPNAKVWEKSSRTPEEKFLGLNLSDVQAEIKSDPAQYPNGDIYSNRKKAALKLTAEDAAAKRGPKDTGARDTARGDRNYDFNVKELDKERAPLEATMQKISAGMTNLNLNSAQADAFLAPQILTLSAGGAGSGLRMNEAEISRVLAGRTTWESLKAIANKYSLDPQHVQIPVEQRQAMADILKAAQSKGTLKSGIIQWADEALINSDDAKSQRQAVATARALLTAVDEGKRVQRNKTTGEFRIAPGE